MACMFNDGIYKWPTGTHVQLSDHFWTQEFDCPRLALVQQIDTLLVDKLELVRVELGMPITVTSGYRNEAYNSYLKALGYKTVKRSQHLLGKAADITCRDLDKLLVICEKHFKAIGVGKTFIHVDLRDDKDRRWGY